MNAAPEPASTFDPAFDPVLPTGRRRRLWPRFAIAMVLGLVAVLALGVGAMFAYDQQYQGRILPGVRVGAVDLSGLSPDDAAARLHAAYDALGAGTAVVVASAAAVLARK